MGMTDSQWKAFLLNYRSNLEELSECLENNNIDGLRKKLDKMIEVIQKSLEQ